MDAKSLKIEKGIPVPAPRSSAVSGIMRKLKVNESVVLPVKISHASMIARRTIGKGKYTARTIDKTHTRVWRIK